MDDEFGGRGEIRTHDSAKSPLWMLSPLILLVLEDGETSCNPARVIQNPYIVNDDKKSMAWLYKRGKTWWIGWMENGRQRLRSTGTDDKSKAERLLKQRDLMVEEAKQQRLSEEFFHGITGRSLPRVTLKREFEDWLAESKGGNSGGTFERYASVATRLCEFLKADDATPLMRDVSAEELRSFLAHRRTSASVATVNLERKILGIFFNRAFKGGIIRANPVLQVKPFKADKLEKGRRRAFTLAELRLLLEKAPSDFWKFMIRGGFYTGLRLGDLVTLRIGAIDLGARVIRLTTRKTDRRMVIPIAGPFLEVIAQRLQEVDSRRPQDPLWPEEAARYEKSRAKVFSNEFYNEMLVPAGLAPARSYRKLENRKGRAAERESIGISFHCLRHSFVSMLKATGGNQAVAKELAGHSSDLVSDLYTHLPVETLSLAINRLPTIAFTGDLFDERKV